ncbi:unnamed protein product, partial [Bubo scandiacus]
MECPGVLPQLSILTAAVQLPFEKAELLGKTTQRKPTLAIKAYSVPIFTLHSLVSATLPKATSHRTPLSDTPSQQYSTQPK